MINLALHVGSDVIVSKGTTTMQPSLAEDKLLPHCLLSNKSGQMKALTLKIKSKKL